MRTLLIDNYDSYTYNLYQLIAVVSGEEPIVVQNDDYESDWDKLCTVLVPGVDFHNIIVSPGPGHPAIAKDVGLSAQALKMSSIPIFGVCLGYQLLAHISGSTVVRAPEPVHGQVEEIAHDHSTMFQNIPSPFKVVRYHSLIVSEDVSNPKLKIVARTKTTKLPMALCLTDETRIAWGVQFHPESISTEFGAQLLKNFLDAADAFMRDREFIGRSWTPDLPTSWHISETTIQDNYVVKVKQISMPTWFDPACEFGKLFDSTRKSSCAWLDSAQSNSTKSRFSYMSNDEGPLSKVVEFFMDPSERSLHEENNEICSKFVLRETCSRSGKEISRRIDQDIFDFLENSIEEWSRATTYVLTSADKAEVNRPLSDWDLPFPMACGYVGYLGYGLRKLCGIKATIARTAPPSMRRKLSGVSYATTEHYDAAIREQCLGADQYVPDACFMFVDRVLVWDNVTSICSLVWLEKVGDVEPSENVQEQRSWVAGMSRALEQAIQRGPQDDPTMADVNLDNVLISSVCDETYKTLINQCIEQIHAGETYEVCLTKQLFRESSEVSNRASELYDRLRLINPAPYAGFLRFKTPESSEIHRHSDVSICCSSPERFMRISQNGAVESKPIKGTSHRGKTPQEDESLRNKLQSSIKDRSENLMITDLVRNDMGKVCTIGSVSVPKLMDIESFASVHQMVTTVQGQLKPECGPVEAIRAAFPGGSMTGAPKLRTMQIIDKLEMYERGIYSGALGFFSLTGAIDLNIVIRTAVITPRGVSVGTGGAIVALSDAQEEVDETKLKAWKLHSAVAPFV